MFQPARTILSLCLLAVAPLAPAATGLSLQDAWIRHLPGTLPDAGYFTLRNATRVPVSLVGARSPAFGRVMLHHSVRQPDGRTRMVPVARVDVPAGGAVRFAPGAYHLMLTQPRHPAHVGDRIPVTLIFADGHQLTAAFGIRPASAIGPR